MTTEKKMDANDVLAALSKHYHRSSPAADYSGKSYAFFDQVRVDSRGPKTLILDAAAVRKSFAHPDVIGFEIKVSRGDFRSDGKWTEYLKYCNRFFFACPPGIVKPDELPPGVGLVHALPDGGLKWVRKATTLRTPQDIGHSIYQYLVVSRLKTEERICPFHAKERRAEHFMAFLESKGATGTAGFAIGQKIRDILSGKWQSERVNERELQLVRAVAKRYDIDFQTDRHTFSRPEDFESYVDRICDFIDVRAVQKWKESHPEVAGVDSEMQMEIRKLTRKLESALATCKGIEARATAKKPEAES